MRLTSAFLALVLCGFLCARPVVAAETVNKVLVRTLEFGYRLDKGTLKVRVTLVTGRAFDQQIEDPQGIAALLKIAEIFAKGGVHLYAQFDSETLTALDVSVP
jgi:hypothetical protein